MWGAILQSRIKPSPAVFSAASVPMLGVEPEVAFSLEADIGPEHRSLSLADFDRLTSVVPTIEIVDTRFMRYEDAPLLHRAADFMSNGGLVVGETWTDPARTTCPGWRSRSRSPVPPWPTPRAGMLPAIPGCRRWPS